VVQRTSSDLRLNPHLHVVFLDGAYHQDSGELAWQELGQLRIREAAPSFAPARPTTSTKIGASTFTPFKSGRQLRPPRGIPRRARRWRRHAVADLLRFCRIRQPLYADGHWQQRLSQCVGTHSDELLRRLQHDHGSRNHGYVCGGAAQARVPRQQPGRGHSGWLCSTPTTSHFADRSSPSFAADFVRPRIGRACCPSSKRAICSLSRVLSLGRGRRHRFFDRQKGATCEDARPPSLI